MSPTEAQHEVKANAGTQFDPVVARALGAVLEEERGAGVQAPRGAIPAAEHRTTSGSATGLGDARRRCRCCGMHVAATLSSPHISSTLSANSQRGSCSNCGSYELEPVEG